MTYNCLITIKKVTGLADNKSFTSLATGVRALIIPASNEILALYPDLPAGQSYSFVINSDAIADVPAESEFTVTDNMTSELANNDTFTALGLTRKNKVMRNFIHSGTCVKKEVEA
jgi:hypothetical protein